MLSTWLMSIHYHHNGLNLCADVGLNIFTAVRAANVLYRLIHVLENIQFLDDRSHHYKDPTLYTLSAVITVCTSSGGGGQPEFYHLGQCLCSIGKTDLRSL